MQDLMRTERPAKDVGTASRITITLPGEPQAKGRPRFRTVQTKDGRSFASAYTPGKTRTYETALRQMAVLAMRSKQPLDGPLKVIVTAFMGVPPSWSKKKRDAALAGAIRPGRPDLDNLLKSALDPLNEVVYGDDAQIVEAVVIKVYSDNPRLRIEVDEIDAL